MQANRIAGSSGKWLGGLGTLAAGFGVFFMKCPLCWLAMGSAFAATYWPVMAIPALLFVAYQLRCRAACAKQRR